jgi:hypothetical protein
VTILSKQDKEQSCIWFASAQFNGACWMSNQGPGSEETSTRTKRGPIAIDSTQ